MNQRRPSLPTFQFRLLSLSCLLSNLRAITPVCLESSLYTISTSIVVNMLDAGFTWTPALWYRSSLLIPSFSQFSFLFRIHLSWYICSCSHSISYSSTIPIFCVHRGLHKPQISRHTSFLPSFYIRLLHLPTQHPLLSIL